MKTKDVVTILLASSVMLIPIGFAISQVLNVITNKPHFIEYSENKEVRGKDGNIVVDNKGNPKFKKVTKYKVLQPKKSEKHQCEIKLDYTNGISIKVSSEVKQ